MNRTLRSLMFIGMGLSLAHCDYSDFLSSLSGGKPADPSEPAAVSQEPDSAQPEAAGSGQQTTTTPVQEPATAPGQGNTPAPQAPTPPPQVVQEPAPATQGDTSTQVQNPPAVSDGTVKANIAPGRLRGVAPLAVLFDGSESTGSARAFHSLQYAWTFGDAGAGTWAETGHSKNSAHGPITAHVFDKPGTYKVTLDVRNTAGKGAHSEVTITVDDPEAVFASSTVCFSRGSDFSGCPAGAKQVTTANYDEIAAHANTSRRLLLKRGDTWDVNNGMSISNKGPGMVGAFGPCVGKDARGMCTNAPVLQTTNPQTHIIDTQDDWRVMDLKFVGIAGDSHQSAVGIGSGTGTLVYRVRTVRLDTAIQSTFWQVDQDQSAIVDCEIGTSNNNQMYVGGERLMILGNHLHDSFTSHVLRVWHAYKSVIAENLIENASIGGDHGRHALKLHGFAEAGSPYESTLADGKTPSGGPLHRTQFVNVCDNTFGASPPWPVSVGPQYQGVDERVSDVLFERNYWRTSGTSYPGAQPLDSPIHSAAVGDLTVRNNIFNATGAGPEFAALTVERYSTSPATIPNMQFLNNLVYRSDVSGSRVRMVNLSSDTRDAVVSNNLGVAPRYSASGQVVVENNGQGTVVGKNAYIANPNFASDNPQRPLDFCPKAGAGSIDKGGVSNVVDDSKGVIRPANAVDLGPYEYVAP